MQPLGAGGVRHLEGAIPPPAVQLRRTLVDAGVEIDPCCEHELLTELLLTPFRGFMESLDSADGSFGI